MSFPSLGPTPMTSAVGRLARQRLEFNDASGRVGPRHHNVPAFSLRRFTDGDRRLPTWDRPTGRLFARTVPKLAITSLYAVVSNVGTFGRWMGQLLGKVEGEAAQLLKLLLSPHRQLGPLTGAQQAALCQFLAVRARRDPAPGTFRVGDNMVGDEVR
jgi:hypothetical protein